MTPFEVFALIALGMIALSLISLVTILDKWARHFSNIADRLLDIERILEKRR